MTDAGRGGRQTGGKRELVAVSFKLPVKLNEELKNYADARAMSKTRVVVEALEDKLNIKYD